jgi:hypothetical protein
MSPKNFRDRFMEENEKLKLFEQSVKAACKADTALLRFREWLPNNPTMGHCAPVACLVKELFGGEIVIVGCKSSDEDIKFARYHYFNILPNGKRADATLSQFGPSVIFEPSPTESNERLREHTRKVLQKRNSSKSMYEYLIDDQDFCQRLETMRERLPEWFPPENGDSKPEALPEPLRPNASPNKGLGFEL